LQWLWEQSIRKVAGWLSITSLSLSHLRCVHTCAVFTLWIGSVCVFRCVSVRLRRSVCVRA